MNKRYIKDETNPKGAAHPAADEYVRKMDK